MSQSVLPPDFSLYSKTLHGYNLSLSPVSGEMSEVCLVFCISSSLALPSIPYLTTLLLSWPNCDPWLPCALRFPNHSVWLRAHSLFSLYSSCLTEITVLLLTTICVWTWHNLKKDRAKILTYSITQWVWFLKSVFLFQIRQFMLWCGKNFVDIFTVGYPELPQNKGVSVIL